MSIALVAIMATVFTVSAFAANTVEIGNITIGKYYDTVDVEGVATQVYNDAYAVVTVPYTVTGDVDRLTFYLAAQDLSSALEGEEAKVIYIDETVNPEAASFTFVIEKDRVRTAFTSAEKIAADATVKDAYGKLLDLYPLADGTVSPFVMTFKLGGTDVDLAASKSIVFTNPAVYGDVNLNNALQPNDAAMTLRSIAGTYALTDEKEFMADVNANGSVQPNDAAMILRCIAGTYQYSNVVKFHFN